MLVQMINYWVRQDVQVVYLNFIQIVSFWGAFICAVFVECLCLELDVTKANSKSIFSISCWFEPADPVKPLCVYSDGWFRVGCASRITSKGQEDFLENGNLVRRRRSSLIWNAVMLARYNTRASDVYGHLTWHIHEDRNRYLSELCPRVFTVNFKRF